MMVDTLYSWCIQSSPFLVSQMNKRLNPIENAVFAFYRDGEIDENLPDENSMKAVSGVTGKEIITFGWEESCNYSPAGIVHEPRRPYLPRSPRAAYPHAA